MAPIIINNKIIGYIIAEIYFVLIECKFSYSFASWFNILGNSHIHSPDEIIFTSHSVKYWSKTVKDLDKFSHFLIIVYIWSQIYCTASFSVFSHIVSRATGIDTHPFNKYANSLRKNILSFSEKKHNLGIESSANQVSKPIYKTSKSRWVRDLSKNDKTIVKEVAGELLIELGYAKDFDW